MLTLGIGRVQKTNGWEQRTLKKVVANVTSPSYSNTLSTIRIACNDHIYRQQGGILFCLRHNEIFFKSFFLSVLDEVAFIILGIKTKTRINFNKSIFLITQPSASQLSLVMTPKPLTMTKFGIILRIQNVHVMYDQTLFANWSFP